MSRRRVTVVGTGVIGASWTTHFLARGLDVVATDVADGAEDRLRVSVDASWHAASELAGGVAPGRLTFVADLEEAVEGASVVQENLPEDLDLKRRVLAQIDGAAHADAIIASSSSALKASDLQRDCTRHPDRVLVAHPFDPPHIVPLVEVVAGRRTSQESVDRAMTFYAEVGKQPVRVRAEVPGHIANRLQAALWREAYSLVASGVATVTDVDLALRSGPGPRWALYGPFVNLHLSGGAGGISRVHEHLGPTMTSLWADFTTPELDDGLTGRVERETEQLVADEGGDSVQHTREELLVRLLALRSTT